MKIDILITSFETGIRRGYISVADRKESELIPLPETLKGIRGNKRKALEKFANRKCTHYTIEERQLANSTQYCFTKFCGYRRLYK